MIIQEGEIKEKLILQGGLKLKAVIIKGYGSADQLKYMDVDNPSLKDNDVLIEVAAASVNPIDWKLRKGYLQEVIPHKLPTILGLDAAGVVIEVGKNVTSFKAGDEVFTLNSNGNYAEYVAVDETLVARKPDNLSYQEAASIPLVGQTSWQALVDFANIKEGHQVLIHAGAGGIGSFAIQLAKAYGAWVAATCSTKNVEFVHSLGADRVIDYEKENFTKILHDMDIVFDTLGGDIQKQSYDVLKEGGILVSIVDNPDRGLANRKKVKAGFAWLNPDGKRLAKIGELLEQGKIVANVGTVMKLEDIQEAHRLSETHHAKGKIVIQVK